MANEKVYAYRNAGTENSPLWEKYFNRTIADAVQMGADDPTTIKEYVDNRLSLLSNDIANEDLVVGEDGKLYIEQGDGATKGNGVELPSSGKVTQEQIDSAVTSYLNANPISGGMTTTAKNLLITILRNAMYTTNQSANITALESALASSTDIKTYNITNTLTNVINSNSSTIIEEKASYNATLTANNGYSLSDVTITMGDTDITSSCYSEGIITISEVTGDIVITANATQVATVYSIEYVLGNCVSSNKNESITENDSYSTIITPNEGYVLSTAIITMGGTDITSSCYVDGSISISQVTGNIVITVNAIVEEKAPELVTDGLENYFDFRTATYNNTGAGGSTIINATQGNGSLYAWSKNMVTAQDDYGITQANARSWTYNGDSVGTTTTSLGTSFTVIFKSYLTNTSSPLFDKGYAMASNVNKITYAPKYKTTSGTGNVTNTGLGTRKDSGYDTVTLIVDGNICKLYFGTELMQTNDGSTISDFQGWYDQLTGISILGNYQYGHLTQMAVYNKALSEVELVDMINYLKSLEVA